ncbi:biotin/lipoate A/B protein ligase family protein [Leptospira inadai serovar Lyme str. 10]|uniref:Biotin/lipoate A/B protein ligase family protein n=2 Tax=Leptospira inadai serovar Lyme TaxID=293084 RepID=V6HCG1_9LEPT|nr:lipoate--protein ligase [Leptospira inadai]EQA36543.1 biotin/lipoate A/B protein ligase family protein [Leptospira inadai serovar Lyme str. 10]PNV74620.1 lipoate--protein ligase [Leptospira inadai serovar Lyme]
MQTFLLDQRSLRTPYYNLALEEALALRLVAEGYGGGIRFWESPRSVIIGLSEDPRVTVGKDLVESFLRFASTRGLPKKPNKDSNLYLARRASGGGTVVHEPGWNLNFSMFASIKERPELFPVGNSYKILLGIASQALSLQGIESKSMGKSDLALEESDSSWKKISGNAQFRKKDCIVQHGTLILDSRLIRLVSDLLPHPPEEPEYRSGREHKEFVTSLPKHFSEAKFKRDLTLLFADYLGVKNMGTRISRSFRKSVVLEANKLFQEKYVSLEFITGER